MAGEKDTLGKVLSIPDDVTKKIGKVVAGINQIEKAANSMASSVSAAYKELGGSGLSAFMQQVAKATKTMQSNKIVDVDNIKEATSQTEKLANAVSKVAQSLSNFSSPIVQNDELSNALARYNALKKQVEEFERKKASGRDTKLDDIRTTKAKEELRILEAKIPVLQANANWAKKSNEEFREQIAHLSGMSLPLQKSKQTLAEYAKYYKELEKEQERLAKEEEKRAKDQLRAQEKLAKEESRRIAQATKEQERLARIREKESEREANKMMATPQGALYSAGISESYAQKVQALKNLETAYKNLGKTDADVAMKAKLAEKMRELRAEVKKADTEMGRVKKNIQAISNYGQQLKRAIALAFSVSQIRNFVVSVAEVRGEFEKQEAALGAMLKSTTKAAALFTKIKGLALQSPFSVKELFETSKQLSAYQIEYEKLYDTTKRLSDVSAGLGVDVGRLVLAFGQVKAANFLRATELRQFTEAGIDMLGELARYYSELEGRMISVGEVQSRITKRMVSFGAVEEVFRRITNAGGLYYDMQAKMADTLVGQMSNLKDAVSLMKNEIGLANEGVLKGFVSMLRFLVENWEALALMIKLAIPALISWGVKSVAATQATTALGIGVKFLSASIKALLSPLSLVLIGVEAIIWGFQRWSNAEKRRERNARTYVTEINNLKKIRSEYDNITKSAEAAADKTRNVADKTEYEAKVAVLSKLVQLLKDLGIEDSRIVPDVREVKESEIDDTIANLEKVAKKAIDLKNLFSTKIGKQKEGVEWFGLLGNNLKTNAEQAARYALILEQTIEQQRDFLKLNTYASSVIGESLAPQKEDERRIDYLYRVAEAMQTLRGLEAQQFHILPGGMVKEELELAREAYSELESASRHFIYANNQTFNEFDKTFKYVFGNLEKAGKALEEDPIEIAAVFNTAQTEQEIDDFATELAYKYFPIRFSVEIEGPSTDLNELEGWRDKVSKALKNAKGLSVAGLTDDDLRRMEDATKAVDLLRNAYEGAKKTATSYSKKRGAITKEEVEYAETQITLLKQVAKELGITIEKRSGGGGKDPYLDNVKELISLIQKANKEYDKLLDVRSKEFSLKQINESFGGLISGLAQNVGLDGAEFVSSMTFDVSGLISSLEAIAKKAAEKGNQEAKKATEKALAEINSERYTLDVEIDIKDFKAKLSGMFDAYDLGKEMEKLGLGKELTSKLFGFDSTSLSDIRKQVEGYFNAIRDAQGELPKKYQNAYDDAMKQITKAEITETRKRIEKYAEYLKESVSERVKIERDYAHQVAEIQELLSKGIVSEPQASVMKSAVRSAADEALDKSIWEDFQKSQLYIDMFDNLEKASKQSIDYILAELYRLKNSLNDLPPEQLKQIVTQIDKLEEIRVDKSSIGELFQNIKEAVKARRELKSLESISIQATEKESTLKAQVDEQQLLVDKAREQYEIALKSEALNPVAVLNAKNKLKQQENILANLKNQYETQQKVTKTANENTSAARRALNLGAESVQEALANASNAGGALTNLKNSIEGLFGEMGDGLSDAFDYVIGIFEGIGGIETGLSQIMSGKIFTGIINTISGLFTTIAGLFGFQVRDNALEREIQDLQEEIENLGKAFDKLQEQIDNAFSANIYEKASDAAIENLKAQNDALEKAIAAEDDKKKTDDDRIKEWRESIEQNLEKIKELEEQAISAYGGFGTSDAIKSAAEEFVSAWVSAYNETGDGLKGLQDQMDSFIENAVKKQLLMRLSEQYISPILSQFDKMFEDSSEGGRVMTEAELEAWKRLYEANSKAFDEKAKAYMDALNIEPSAVESELSGLQRGIQGVTETTAQALEALLNSIRYYSSDTNLAVRDLYNIFTTAGEDYNPMLMEMRTQTQWLSNIHSLVKSLSRSVGTNGSAMKVVIV